MATGEETNKSHLERLSSNNSMLSFSSVGSDILSTATTANCEIALLPLKLLVDLQSNYLTLEDDMLTSNNGTGGFNLFSDGSALIDGCQCKINNYIQRKVTLRSHADYKDYRETMLAKPMLFITNAKKVNSTSTTAKTFAVIVNTRHPQIRTRLEAGMNDVISSVMGENYQLQFNLYNDVREYLQRQDFVLTEDNLSFSYTFKLDVLVDFFYWFGLSKKTCDLHGKLLNLHCTNNSRKERVRLFLSKMTTPLIRLGSSLDHDRRPSIFSLDIITEDPFMQEEDVTDTAPVLQLNSEIEQAG
ncbi:mesenteric estrogen-dependent adipogenesis protein [Bufo bufo]|uniref:mesenteric estrogen-dependent adipogenesis protein n=1 Tax=Bufo bufo TaxID=8384 RepID=UPI001ABE1B68|nr:mesenteric estrogen-dependent adipogenesis protein [Bufo bufo]